MIEISNYNNNNNIFAMYIGRISSHFALNNSPLSQSIIQPQKLLQPQSFISFITRNFAQQHHINWMNYSTLCTTRSIASAIMNASSTATTSRSNSNNDTTKDLLSRHTGFGGRNNNGGIDDNDNDEESRRRQDFNLQVGKAIDTLTHEWETYFEYGLEDYDIYHPSIRFSEPNHNKFHVTGKQFYKMFMSSARHVFRWYFSDLQFRVQSVSRPIDTELSIKWSMEGCSRPSIVKSILSHQQYVEKSVYEGIFVYKFDRDGMIVEHQMTDLLPVPRRFAPLHAIGWWQKLRSPVPDIADAMKKT